MALQARRGRHPRLLTRTRVRRPHQLQHGRAAGLGLHAARDAPCRGGGGELGRRVLPARPETQRALAGGVQGRRVLHLVLELRRKDLLRVPHVSGIEDAVQLARAQVLDQRLRLLRVGQRG